MERIDIDGITFALQESGDPTARPFVWGHGLTSSRAQEDAAGIFGWDRIPGVRVVRYDARGHGQTGGTDDPATYRWDRLARDMVAVLDDRDIERAVLGGASMGCATALGAALVAPARVEALVLVIPPTAWESRAAQSGTYLAGADLVDHAGPAALADTVREQPAPAVFADVAELVQQGSAAAIEAMDPDLLPHVLRGAAGSDLPDPSTLATIAVPTLVLAWAGDPGHPVSSAEAIAAAIPNATLEVADDLGQVLGWVDRVAAFLASLPA